jgi:hypothetical protein
MSATDEQIARLRRMVNELLDTTYSNTDLAATIERYPLVDALGNDPLVKAGTYPETLIENDDWTATYDLNSAAADIWQEKAAPLGGDYDFSADGASYSRSQAHQQAMQMARYYRARRSPNVIMLRPEPWVPESEDIHA